MHLDKKSTEEPLANLYFYDGMNLTFSWVRLAQIISVRIAMDSIKDPRVLIAGRTASVTVLQ
jgi:multidrug resistance efflux pump